MLVGIKAFEARWSELRSLHPTTAEENIIIAHAMGRLADHYETADEIIGGLPNQLKTLFQELMDAYLNGYTAATSAEDPPHKPATQHSPREKASRQDWHDPHSAETLILDREFIEGLNLS